MVLPFLEFRRSCAFVLLLAVVVCIGSQWAASASDSPIGQQSTDTTGTVETQVVRPGIEPGVGADQRSVLQRAQALVVDGKVAEAEQVLQQIISAIERQIGKDDRTRVCVANKEEFARFASEHGDTAKVVWVDWAYREAIQTQAFIAAARGEFEDALSILKRVEALSPFDPASLIERGFVLNKLGRSSEALESYRRAYELTQQFSSARPSAPSALRGIGFALVELGDLKGARKAYEDSLKLEPNNPTALHELDYIRSLEKANR